MSEELSFTGERLIPGKVDADLLNEHFVRYRYAQDYCSGKSVLDTGCGVGYGSSHLAEVAHDVVAVDNDPQVVQYARRRYSRANVRYVVSDCQELPFRSQSFDVITSFELIEHLPDAKRYLKEIRRVLRAGGAFIVSTPNRSVYGEHRGGEANPFHIREWDFNEFVGLLREYFGFVEVLGQSQFPAVGILDPAKTAKISAAVEAGPAPAAADYFVCICSQQAQCVSQMVLASSSGNVLLERERHIKLLSNELAERIEYLGRLQADFDEKAIWADHLNAEVSTLRAQVRSLEDKIQELSVLRGRARRWKRAFFFLALAPLDWIVGCAVLGAELVSRLFQKKRPIKAPLVAPADTSRCSIIVLSWEGKELLAESLPALLQAVQFHGENDEVIVLDNGSSDGTSEYVASNFPEVRVVRSDRNIFYTGGNNLGVQAAKNDIVVLLNNDMVVREDFLAPLLQGFRDADVFAVGSQVFLADPNKRREETGKTRARFNGCDLEWAHDEILSSDEEQKYVPVFWGHGGAVALDRQKYLWLGGLDTEFDPFYVEDADLSYRAWKVGWRCLLAIDSHVIHKHRGTNAPRYGSRFIAQIVRRNQSLFIWKNFGDLGMLAKHFLRSPRRRMRRAGVPGVGIKLEATALLGAVRRLPAILKLKLQLARAVMRSDEEILQFINTPPTESIRKSEVDFEHEDGGEQLGDGWYARDHVNGKSFRWMSKRASLFLRAPAETAEFSLRGYASSAPDSDSFPLTIAVNCQGQRKSFKVLEGPIQQRWTVTGLVPDTPVAIQLGVSRAFSTPTDSRILGIIVQSVALSAGVSLSGGGQPAALHPAVSIAKPLPVAKMRVAGQRRILIVCAYLPCLGIHGGGNMMFHLIRTLSKRHRLTVLTFYERDEELEQIPQLAPFCENLEAIFRGQSFDHSNLLGLRPPEILNEFYHERMRALVDKYLQTHEFDIMQCEYLQTAHFANVDRGIPAVLTMHELLSLSYADRYRSLRWSSARKKLSALTAWMRMLDYQQKLLRRFSGVVVLTEREEKFLAQYVEGAKIYQHPMGVDCDFFKPDSAPPEEKSVVFVGNFQHTPNSHGSVWFLRQVWPRIRARHPGAHLYLVGGSPPTELSSVDGFDGVSVTGFVQDVRPYLQRAAIFVAPIFEGAGLRTKVLEAWAMQKAVVGTPLAFEGLTDQDGEICRMAEGEESFANRVCELFEQPKLASHVGVRAREFVLSRFSWENFACLYDRIYEKVLESGAHSTRTVIAPVLNDVQEDKPQVSSKATGG